MPDSAYLLLDRANVEVGLVHQTSDAADFADEIRRLASKTGNLEFEVYEAPSYVSPQLC